VTVAFHSTDPRSGGAKVTNLRMGYRYLASAFKSEENAEICSLLLRSRCSQQSWNWIAANILSAALSLFEA
jgi:hypothetical protein